ncbi:MAG: polysaccharide pyruvyl transferase family protein [Acidimicrobiia bacterium]
MPSAPVSRRWHPRALRRPRTQAADVNPELTRRTPPRVAMFGLFGVGNIGNEASLTAGVRAVRHVVPDADVIVVGAYPEVVSGQHGLASVSLITGGALPKLWSAPRLARVALRPLAEPLRWWSVGRFLRSVDAVVVPGTGILDDFGVGPQQMPYDIFRWTTLARLTRTPWAMVAVGAGPIEHRASRWLMTQAVANSTVVTYRDEGSRRFMTELGRAASPDAVQPDVVFSFPLPTDHRPGESPGHVGLGVMAYRGWSAEPAEGSAVFDRYVDALGEIAVRLIERGHRLRLLVGEDDDAIAVERVLEIVRRKLDDAVDAVIVEPIRTFDDLMVQVSFTDAVVATRFHNIVAALMMSRPTVSLGYAEKNRELMTRFGLGDRCQHVEHIDVEQVLDDTEAVLRDRKAITDAMGKVNSDNRSEVERRFAGIFAALGLS